MRFHSFKLKYVFLPIFSALFLTCCTEPAYKFTNNEQLDTLWNFPLQYQGVYANGSDTLFVSESSYYIKQGSWDNFLLIDTYGELGDEQYLEKRGDYYIYYMAYVKDIEAEYYRMRFFSLTDSILKVNKIKEDDQTLSHVIMMAKGAVVESDSSINKSTYFFTIDRNIQDKLIDGYLEQEMQLIKVK